MAVSDTPPIGLTHPTVNPDPVEPADGHDDRCRCTDCDFTVAIGDGLPRTCPECDGALALSSARDVR